MKTKTSHAIIKFLLVLIVLGWCCYRGLYCFLNPNIEGLGCVKLGDVASHIYNHTSTNFMCFDSISWEATPMSLKTYAVYCQSTNYSEDDVRFLGAFLGAMYGSPCEIYEPGRKLASLGFKLCVTNSSELAGNIKCLERIRTILAMQGRTTDVEAVQHHLDSIKDCEKWYLRFKIDENCSSNCGNAVGRLVTGDIFRRRRHIAVFERGKGRTNGSSADDSMDRGNIILIAWDDYLLDVNNREICICSERQKNVENK